MRRPVIWWHQNPRRARSLSSYWWWSRVIKTNQDIWDGNALLVTACETEISVRSDNGGEVVLACSIIRAAAESVRWKSSVLLIYYREEASNLTTSEPSPREVVYQVANNKVRVYIYIKKRDNTHEIEISSSLQCSRWERLVSLWNIDAGRLSIWSRDEKASFKQYFAANWFFGGFLLFASSTDKARRNSGQVPTRRGH